MPRVTERQLSNARIINKKRRLLSEASFSLERGSSDGDHEGPGDLVLHCLHRYFHRGHCRLGVHRHLVRVLEAWEPERELELVRAQVQELVPVLESAQVVEAEGDPDCSVRRSGDPGTVLAQESELVRELERESVREQAQESELELVQDLAREEESDL